MGAIDRAKAIAAAVDRGLIASESGRRRFRGRPPAPFGAGQQAQTRHSSRDIDDTFVLVRAVSGRLLSTHGGHASQRSDT
ncbi:MAG TPA: hypothetical protein VKD69_24710 [Vicinamibacterales bacterium]|nr:hypothetical protein [Vicinamibacterales bacterium]